MHTKKKCNTVFFNNNFKQFRLRTNLEIPVLVCGLYFMPKNYRARGFYRWCTEITQCRGIWKSIPTKKNILCCVKYFTLYKHYETILIYFILFETLVTYLIQVFIINYSNFSKPQEISNYTQFYLYYNGKEKFIAMSCYFYQQEFWKRTSVEC